MWRAVPIPEPVETLLTSAVGVSRRQLMQAGAEDVHIARLIRSGRLVRVGRGRYVLDKERRRRETDGHNPGETDRAERLEQHLDRLHALQRKFPDAIVAGRSAALARGHPVWRFPPRPELIRHSHVSLPDDVYGWRICPLDCHVDDLDGLRITTPARTACDLAVAWPIPVSLVTIDAVLRTGVRPQVLTDILASRGPIHHIRRARQAVAFGDAASESPLESYGRGTLLVAGVPVPAVNPSLRLPGGWVRVDLLWPELGIVGEADGALKYGASARQDALWSEKLRQEAWEQVGLKVLRWTAEEIARYPDRVVARFARMAAGRPSAGAGEPWRALETRLGEPSEPWTP